MLANSMKDHQSFSRVCPDLASSRVLNFPHTRARRGCAPVDSSGDRCAEERDQNCAGARLVGADVVDRLMC